MFDPHPTIRDVSIADIDAFLSEILTGKTAEHAKRALTATWRVPDWFPPPSRGGYPNNADQIRRAVLRFRAARAIDAGPLAQNSIDYGLAWLRGAYTDPDALRDEQHRRLMGVLELMHLAVDEEEPELVKECHWAMGQAFGDRQGINKLEEYARNPNLRTIMRAAENAMVGACYLAELGDEPRAHEIAGRVIDPLLYFLSLEFEVPKSDHPDEAPGWGTDSTGCPFHVDRLGRGDDPWEKQQNGLYMPWQEFHLQVNALRVIRAAVEYLGRVDFPLDLIQVRLEQLEEWFWTRAYHDADEPIRRGFGRTEAFHVFKSLDPLVVANPTEIGIPTGEMLWAPFALLHNRPIEDVARMYEALVVQGIANWKEDWPKQLWCPESLEVVAHWKAGWGKSVDTKPELSIREELRRAIRVLRHAECPRAAQFLQDTAHASITLVQARRGL